MKHIFLTDAAIVSPRWQQAFPDALVISMLPDNWETEALSERVLWWCLFDDPQLHVQVKALLSRSKRVIALTRMEKSDEVRRAIADGARGYLHYLAVASMLEQVADVVKGGGLWLGADLMRALVMAPPLAVEHEPGAGLLLARLTPRERSVAEAVASGHTNKEIARSLDIAERTVKAHLSAVFEKLKIRDRLQLALVVNQGSRAG